MIRTKTRKCDIEELDHGQHTAADLGAKARLAHCWLDKTSVIIRRSVHQISTSRTVAADHRRHLSNSSHVLQQQKWEFEHVTLYLYAVVISYIPEMLLNRGDLHSWRAAPRKVRDPGFCFKGQCEVQAIGRQKPPTRSHLKICLVSLEWPCREQRRGGRWALSSVTPGKLCWGWRRK